MCLIARDEQDMLASCLGSVRADVDQVVVVDTGSRDRTVSIARQCGAAVWPYAWNDDFAAARNHSLAKAHGDWILVLDCDERLAPQSCGAIRRAVAASERDAFLLRFLNMSRHGPTEEWQALRLFRNRPGVHYEGRVHEQLIFPAESPAPASVPVAPGVTVLHFGYQTSLLAGRDKRGRNMRLVEMALAESAQGPAARHSFYLFHQAFGAQGQERAQRLERWVEYVEANPSLEQRPVCPWIPVGLAHYAWLLSDSGSHPRAEARARRLLDQYGEHPVLHLCVARARAAAGDFQGAEKELRLLFDSRPHLAGVYRQFPLDLNLVERWGRRLLGEICERQGRLEHAEHWYRRVVDAEPGHLAALLRLICVLVQRGRFREALKRIESSPDLQSQGLPELDCLGFALTLILQSAERVPVWGEKVRARASQSPLAAQLLDRVSRWQPGTVFRFQDFPELEHGVKLASS